MFGNIIGLICACLSLILNIVALIGNYWLRDSGPELLHEGIWQRCANNTCLKLNGKGYIDATRTLVLLSTVALQFGIVFSGLAFFSFQFGRFTAALIACILESLSGILLFIGLVVYTWEEHLNRQNIPTSSYGYDWAYYLCWTSVGISGIAAISHCQTHKSTPLTSYESIPEGEEDDNVNDQS